MAELSSTLVPEELQPSEASEPFSGHIDAVRSVIFSPNARYIFPSSWDDPIRVWNARIGEAIAAPFRGRSEDVDCIAVSSEGRMVASASDDGTGGMLKLLVSQLSLPVLSAFFSWYIVGVSFFIMYVVVTSRLPAAW